MSRPPASTSPHPSSVRGHGYSFEDDTSSSTRGSARSAARQPMIGKEEYDHIDDYDSNDDVYVSEEERGREDEGVSETNSAVCNEESPRINVYGSEEGEVDEVQGRQGEESNYLPFREMGERHHLYSERNQLPQEARGPQEEQRLSAPHYWQCHLCAYINPLFPPPPPSPAPTNTDPFIDYPQTPHQQSQQQHPSQYSSSFASLPPSVTQPCGNRDVPARAASHTLEYIEAPEKGSWERRVRDAAAATASAAHATNANAMPAAGAGAGFVIGNEPRQMGAALLGGSNIAMRGTSSGGSTPGARMPGPTYSHARTAGSERVVPPSPLRMTAYSSQSLLDDDDDEKEGGEHPEAIGGSGRNDDPLPLPLPLPFVSALATRPEPGAGVAMIPLALPGYGYSAPQLSSAAAATGINYCASIPLSYAFSTADSSRSGSVRSPGMGQVGAWQGGGGFGSGSSGGGVGAGMPLTSSIPVEGEQSPYAWPQPGAVMDERMTVEIGDATQSGNGNGSVFGAGIGGRCWHSRCEGCYDLDAAKRVLGFCAGDRVDGRLYDAWCRSFGFAAGDSSGGGDSGIGEAVVAGGEGGEEEEGVEEEEDDGEEEEEEDEGTGNDDRNNSKEKDNCEDEEEDMNSDNEHDVTELTHDALPVSRLRPRIGSPIQYSTGESLILLVQKARSREEGQSSGSDDDEYYDAGSGKASSDGVGGGEGGVLGRGGSGSGSGSDGGEESG